MWDTTVCGLTLPVYMALLLGLLWNRVLGGRGVTHAVRHQAHTTFSTKNAKHLRKGCEDHRISRDQTFQGPETDTEGEKLETKILSDWSGKAREKRMRTYAGISNKDRL